MEARRGSKGVLGAAPVAWASRSCMAAPLQPSLSQTNLLTALRVPRKGGRCPVSSDQLCPAPAVLVRARVGEEEQAVRKPKAAAARERASAAAGGGARAAEGRRIGRVGGVEGSAGRLDSAGRYVGARRCIGSADRSARHRRLLPVQARAGTGASGADATSLFGNLFVGRSVRASSTPLPPRVLR